MKNSRFEELKAMLLARRDVVVVEVSRHAAKLKEKKTSTDSAVLGLGTEDETVVQLAEMYSHEFQAIDAALANGKVSAEQRPSMGCNIKWKPGHAP